MSFARHSYLAFLLLAPFACQDGGQASPGDAGGEGGSTDDDALGGAGQTSGGRASSGGRSSSGGRAAGGGASDGGSASGGDASGGLGWGGDLMGGWAGEGGGTINRNCEFTLHTNKLSPSMPTVGIVAWSLGGEAPVRARIAYSLDNAPEGTLNLGGVAPVRLGEPGFRTLLLGLKQNSSYTFHIEAERATETCVSDDFPLPTTGSLAYAPSITGTTLSAAPHAGGFVVTSTGFGGGNTPPSAFILDADGDVVWTALAPAPPSRAHMDASGDNVWVMALNVGNGAGAMRRISMDGSEVENPPGFERAHHDFCVMPEGKLAALSWHNADREVESDLLIRQADGTVSSAFLIGNNIYASDTFHANAVHYLPWDDSFTISDRNPNVLVKVSSGGQVEWQLGGDCDAAPAGPDHCSPQTWQVNHGHQLLEDGTFLLFNNTTGGNAHVWEFELASDPSQFAATPVKDYAGRFPSPNLGDVQRLPNGNTLVTYANSGRMEELDSKWAVIQSFSGPFGYADWRPTLYGAPERY